MQNVLQGATQRASEAVSHAMSTDKKTAEMKSNTVEPTSSDRLTSDYGVKQNNTDIWLSASTGDRKGPALLEDNFAREKVRGHYLVHCVATNDHCRS